MSKFVTFDVTTRVVVEVPDTTPASVGYLEAQIHGLEVPLPAWNGTTIAPGQSIGADGALVVRGGFTPDSPRCVEIV